jgi:two-component system OmpR family response regulator
MTRCLVVDDDAELLSSVCAYLGRFGIEAVPAASAAEMWARMAEATFDVVVLDIMLPDGDGLQLCAGLHETSSVPVIMLTAQGDPSSRVLGLELGADDYIGKPFDPRELVARIKAVLRRRSQASGRRGSHPSGVVEFAGWRFDTLKRQLVSPQQVVMPLSSAEYRLLNAFIERPRRVLTRDQLLDATRGPGVVVSDRAIDLAVSRLRQKLASSSPDTDAQLICTVRGEGYMFDAEIKA